MSTVVQENNQSVRLLLNKLQRNIPLFQGLNHEEICFFLEQGQKVAFEKDAVMMQAQTAGKKFFILLNGTVDVWVGDNASPIERKSGNILGEIAALLQIPRTATVKCKTPCVAFQYRASVIQQIEEKSPDLAIKLYKNTIAIMVQRYVIEERR